MVCLAPRAPGEIVRPRRLSGVVVRPLNFTVRGLFGGGAELNAVTFLPVVKIPSFPRRLAPQLRRPSCTAS